MTIDSAARAKAGHSLRLVALIATYSTAAVLGYALGAQGLIATSRASGSSASASLVRVGFALREQDPQVSARAWTALHDDVAATKRSLDGHKREVFELVVAVRGLNGDGNADYGDAEQRCRALHWPRCEQSALEELRRRSRP